MRSFRLTANQFQHVKTRFDSNCDILSFFLQFVPPGGNASFEVVFLARVVGNVENTLFINTVTGTFSYQVSSILA